MVEYHSVHRQCPIRASAYRWAQGGCEECADGNKNMTSASCKIVLFILFFTNNSYLLRDL